MFRFLSFLSVFLLTYTYWSNGVRSCYNLAINYAVSGGVPARVRPKQTTIAPLLFRVEQLAARMGLSAAVHFVGINLIFVHVLYIHKMAKRYHA